jgi:dipeptidyl aminopeptidase/acylaminoacyl peptidase
MENDQRLVLRAGSTIISSRSMGRLARQNGLRVTAVVLIPLLLCVCCDDPYVGDLAAERAKHTTKLNRQTPSPQQAEPLGAAPTEARAVTFNSGSLKLKAWISDIPAGAKKQPAIVYCHGGFAFGEEDWEQAEPFRKAGYIVLMPMLRGENGNPGNFELFYGEVDDAIAAGKFLSVLSGVDKSRIYIAGHSAGGTVAALSALLPSPFTAAAAYGAPCDMETFLARGSQFRGVAPFDSDDATERRLRSVTAFIKTLRCPLYLFAGSTDDFARHSMFNLDTLATNAGKTCQTFVIPGDHFSSVDESIARTIELFNAQGVK